jgi:hypothetical protein
MVARIIKTKKWRNVGSLLMLLALGMPVAVGFASKPYGSEPDSPAITYTVTNTNDSGAGTLRQAITSANSNAGADIIAFNIPGAGVKTIAPLTPLPTITDPVTIDGLTQPGYAGYPLIELSGINLAHANGLHITAGNSTVRGLIIGGFEVPDPDLSIGIKLETGGGNIIRGNCIGTNDACSGTEADASNDIGVHVLNSPNNQIGGTPAGSRNIISGNLWDGVLIEGAGSTGNVVQRCYIGTDVTGSLAVGNGDGIEIRNAPNNTVGGTVPEARNVISGNGGAGVEISGSAATGNLVQGNYIGTNAAGTASLGNYDGVYIAEATNNTIGGAIAGARNIISGNDNYGVDITLESAWNQVQGNYIGTDVTGNTALGNYKGVHVSHSSHDNTIGGLTPGAGNVISGNGYDSVQTYGLGVSGDRNAVYRNFIGTNAAGSSAIPNIGPGIRLLGGYNIIGTQGGFNLISGNTVDGVQMLQCIGCPNPGISNRIQYNVIGADLPGTTAIPNRGAGVMIAWGTGTVIGGAALTAGNLISGNSGSGVRIVPSPNGVVNATVQGNRIGTDISGTGPLHNSLRGVHVEGENYGVINALIGGTTSDRANIIAFNRGDGVLVENSMSMGIGILGNSIHSNNGLAIDLINDDVTPNDPGDPDVGPNNLQNYPVLLSAGSTGSSTTIAGILNSTPNTIFRLEFFSNPACETSGHGEGQTYIGTTSVTTDAVGNATFNVTFPVGVPVGHFITSTATDPGSNTSEFSACAAVVVQPTATQTRTPTNSPTSMPTSTRTNTPVPTNTSTHTRTNTPTNTGTNTATRTNTPTNTATATRTNTPVPMNTATPTRTPTASATSTPGCVTNPNYVAVVSTGATIVPGTSRVPGSICNSCIVNVALPFAYSLYDTPYTSVNVSNKGTLQFGNSTMPGDNTCLPASTLGDAIFAYWDNHNTNINDTMGIFTSTTGTAPNRIFNIEWRTGYVANDVRSRFEVRLYEGEPKFDVIYANTRRGFSATVGVQKGTGERFTQYACNVNGSVPNGTRITFDQRVCSGAQPAKP